MRRGPTSTALRRSILVFAFAACFAAIGSLDLLVASPIAVDFKSFYLAAAAARRGANVYDIQVLEALAAELGVTAPIFPYLYPPFFAYTFSWLGRFGPAAAQGIWSALCVTAFGLAALWSTAILTRPPRPTRAPGAAAPSPLTSVFLYIPLLAWVMNLRFNMAMGQINVLVLAFIAASLALDLSGRERLSGFLLGFAVAIKMTPILLVVPWIVGRRHRPLLGLAIALAAIFLVTLPLGAAAAWWEFARFAPKMSHGAIIPGLFSPGTVWNFSFAGFFARLFGSPLAVRAASQLAILLFLGGALAATAGVPAKARHRRLLLPLLTTMVLASPFAYVHHVIYLFPAALFEIDHLVKSERRVELGVFLFLLSAATFDFPYFYTRFAPGVLPALAVSMNFYALVGVYALGIRAARREARREEARAPVVLGASPALEQG